MGMLEDKRWIVYILPGFVALFVARFISDLPDVSDAQLPVVYIALTALSVSIPLLSIHIYGRVRGIKYSINRVIWSPFVLLSIFASSIILGFGFGVANSTDYVSRTLRAMFGEDLIITSSHDELIRLLLKNSYNENFDDGQPYLDNDYKRQHTNRYARLTFGGGRQSFEGVVAAYFGASDKPQVYLSPACAVLDEKVTIIEGPGAWIDLGGIQDIRFIYAMCSKCASEIAAAAGDYSNMRCPFYNASEQVRRLAN